MLFIFIIISFAFGCYCGKEFKIIKNIIIKKNLSQELSNFISYSQLFEDLILFCIFYDIKNGFYIDIGANDPNYISVTKAFYLRGWNGINIEPLPNKFQELVKYRKRDINIQLGVGDKKGVSNFFGNGTRATLIKDYSKSKSSLSTIKIDTMKNICNKYVPKKKIVQFCKIDIEGGEKNALLGYDFENCRPNIFCIESVIPGTAIPSFDQWEYILFQNDYSFAFQYKVNRYYIDNRIKGLKERFIIAEREIELYKQKK